MDASTIVVIVVIGLIVGCFLLFRAARSQTTDGTHFGSYYWAFLVMFFLTSQLIGEIWHFPTLREGMIHGLQATANFIARKTHGKEMTTGIVPPPPPPADSVPTGDPNSYIEWVDHTHVQPKPGATLPANWTVTIMPSDATKRQRVLAPVEVPDEPLTVYFDPDPASLPTAKSFGQVTVTGRPAP